RTAGRSALFAGTEQHGARAVAEENGHLATALGEFEPGRVNLGPDDEHVSVDAGANPRVRDRQRVEKTRALVSHVESGHARDAELVLEEHARAGKEVIRAQRGEDDRVDVALGLAGMLERHLARVEREVARADAALFDVTPLFDARALLNPFVARGKELGKV